MSEHVPSVTVDLRFGHSMVFDNCEAYVNRKTDDLVILSLQSGARRETLKHGAWSLAVIKYDGEVVHSLTPVLLGPDLTGDASQLGWGTDPEAWPKTVTPASFEDHFDRNTVSLVDGTRTFIFTHFGYHSDDTRAIACANYQAEDGKTLRVANV